MNFEQSLNRIIKDMVIGAGGQQGMFYGLFLAELNKSFSDDFPTACVSKHPGAQVIDLVLGKHWWEFTCFTDGRKMWTLCHELEHVIREHLFEIENGMFPDRHLANIAMDRL